MHSSTDSRFCTFSCLSGEPKPTTSDESATYTLAMTVVIAFVILVFGDQLVEPWVGGIVGNVAGGSNAIPHHHHPSLPGGHHLTTGECGSVVLPWPGTLS